MTNPIPRALVPFALLIAAACSSASAATLVVDGQPKAVIAVPPEPDQFEKLALADLTEYLERISGAKLESTSVDEKGVDDFVAQTKAAGKTPVLIGRIAASRLTKPADGAPLPGAFVLAVDKNSVMIAGTEGGTYYGAIELLEQLGCRWFMPGELGTVVPRMATVELREQRTLQTPSFGARWFQMPDKDWQLRMRCGGPVFVSAHGLPLPKPKPVSKKNKSAAPAEPMPDPRKDRELFALVNGKRTSRQLCISNPKVLELVVQAVKMQRAAKGQGPIVGMGPNDGRGFCQCENCCALDGGDFDPFSGELSVTDRYIWFFNQVLKGVEGDYPDTKIAFYIYAAYMRPPVRWTPDSRIMGAMAPIALDRVHGMSNPLAPEKHYARKLYEQWGKIMPELYDRSYWSNLACPGFPFIIVNRLRDEIPVCHKLGLKGWRVETFPNYGPQFPSMYIAGKLMWNHQADVDALLADCYSKFFGPAAEPMGRYITLMDAALRDSDHATGSSWDMPYFYPAELRSEARKLLDEGTRLAAGKDIYERRVKLIVQTFDLLEEFIGMMDARVRVDFVAAHQRLQKLDAVAGELMEYKPTPMLSAGRHSTYVNYMQRFFRPCTEQGYARVTDGNKLVVAAQDEWQFQIDPLRVGEDIGLWRPEVTGGNWQRIKTSSSSWSNQGLRYYKGMAWYRQTVDVPPTAIGERTFFWCGGVDELAKVWINGRPIGVSHGAAFSPFELDATEAVRPGKNVIAVAVSNEVVNDIGTGGILAPVILYSPKAGKDAVLENVRELKDTFP